MDINTIGLALLKRNPAMTPEEFSHHWFTKHAPLVVPLFLDSGVQHYEQARGDRPLSLKFLPLYNIVSCSKRIISLPLPTTQMHGPLTSAEPTLVTTDWDGAAGTVRPPVTVNGAPAPPPQWKQDYYNEVVLADERRFLVSEARLHIQMVGPGTVRGARRVVIQEGKCVIEVSDAVWRIWRQYEARGRDGSKVE